MRDMSLRQPEDLDQGWVHLTGGVDAAGESRPQAESGRRELDLVDRDHRGGRRRPLILRCRGHHDAGRAPGDMILTQLPRLDKQLEIGLLVERGVLLLHEPSSSRSSSRRSGGPSPDR